MERITTSLQWEFISLLNNENLTLISSSRTALQTSEFSASKDCRGIRRGIRGTRRGIGTLGCVRIRLRRIILLGLSKNYHTHTLL